MDAGSIKEQIIMHEQNFFLASAKKLQNYITSYVIITMARVQAHYPSCSKNLAMQPWLLNASLHNMIAKSQPLFSVNYVQPL